MTKLAAIVLLTTICIGSAAQARADMFSTMVQGIQGFTTPNQIASMRLDAVAATGIASSTKLASVKITTLVLEVSAYSSTPDQTDDTPFITANGTYVTDGIVATNILPFGTTLKFTNCGNIPNDKIFRVADRMNKRYQKNIDVWYASTLDALKLGRRTCQIQVIS